jgi:hypothetical protein
MTLFPTSSQDFIILAIVGGSAALFLVELILVFPARYADEHGILVFELADGPLGLIILIGSVASKFLLLALSSSFF